MVTLITRARYFDSRAPAKATMRGLGWKHRSQSFLCRMAGVSAPRFPTLDPALPIGREFAVDLPSDLAGEGKPPPVMTTVVGEPTAPWRRQRTCRRGPRSIGRERADDPSLVVEAQRDLGPGFSANSG